MTYTNWHYVAETTLSNGEKGIAARIDIPADAIIGIYHDGELRSFAIDHKDRLVDRDAHKYIVQLARSGNQLFGIIKRDGRAGIGFINHSCKANISTRDRVILYANRDISAGETLTVDYRHWDLIHEGIPCWCPEPKCII